MDSRGKGNGPLALPCERPCNIIIHVLMRPVLGQFHVSRIQLKSVIGLYAYNYIINVPKVCAKCGKLSKSMGKDA